MTRNRGVHSPQILSCPRWGPTSQGSPRDSRDGTDFFELGYFYLISPQVTFKRTEAVSRGGHRVLRRITSLFEGPRRECG